MLKERPFWSKVSLYWTFRLADVEGDSEKVVVTLVFDNWTGSVRARVFILFFHPPSVHSATSLFTMVSVDVCMYYMCIGRGHTDPSLMHALRVWLRGEELQRSALSPVRWRPEPAQSRRFFARWLSLLPPFRCRNGAQIQISENAVLKVDEIQKPIIGGAWTTKTDFGRLEIKIVPYWTGKCSHRTACWRRLRYLALAPALIVFSVI